MTPIQQLFLGTGSAVAKKTYVDDVFSTFVYAGNTNGQSINNGIDLAGKGALTWIKQRNGGAWHQLYDTERGATKALYSNGNDAEATVNAGLTAFNNNGFTLGNHGGVSTNGNDYASWTFRKAPGFFDVVTWDGNSTAGRQIAHNLGCVPGCIIVKSYVDSDPRPWRVYHRGVDATAPEDYALRLDGTDARSDNSAFWNDTAPNSSVFTVGNHASTNMSNISYVAYLFAGGESTAATARSVDFDGSDDLRMSGSSDFAFGTGDFTFEAWIKPDSWSNTYHTVFATNATGGLFIGKSPDGFVFRIYNVANQLAYTTLPTVGQWTHVAFSRSGTTLRLFYNGELVKSETNSYDISTTTTYAYIGDYTSPAQGFDGKISNLRIVKGTAVYTSSFRPPTEPLTNITNTKLLCCNNSSVTGATVTPNTISIDHGDPTASTDSPFDDPAAHIFGESGSESVIKCGSYIGGAAGQEINVGFEPQWLLIKSASNTRSWQLVDCMRGFTAKGLNDEFLSPDSSGAESDDNRVWPTPTGFGLDSTDSAYNYSGSTYVYIAIRRSDGYVGKPPELGTGVFAMDTGNGSSTIPCFDSGFPVDLAIWRNPSTSYGWGVNNRLTGQKQLVTNDSSAENNGGAGITWDSNLGWNKDSQSSSIQSWMWKRHAGFDVVAYTGNGVNNRKIPHSLLKTPEMVWVKDRKNTESWFVYHKGLNGGTNPQDYHLRLNENYAEHNPSPMWRAAPTSTHISVGSDDGVNGTYNSASYIAMLFASVDGISKIGYFDGQSSDLTVTFGFQPRFLMLKRTDAAGDWNVYDTTRGLVSGADKELRFNNNTAQSDHEVGDITSTGFTFACGGSHDTCSAGGKWIYYAHA